jgi:hypothetical protein
MGDTPCELVRRAFTAASNRVRVARWIGEQAIMFARRELVGAFHAGAVVQPSSAARTVAPSAPPTGSTKAGRAADDSSVGAPSLDDLPAALPRVEHPVHDRPPVEDPPGGPSPVTDGVVGTLAVKRRNGRSDARAAAVAAPPDDALGSGLPPFEGYDTLPAAHIVQRLARLTAVDLAIVRAYELDHRARRTVVAKVDQLLDA